MPCPSRRPRVYDHRLRDLVRQTGDVAIATNLGVPRATARGWLRQEPRDVVSIDVLDTNQQALRDEIIRLRRRVRVLAAVIRILLALVRVSGFRLDKRRLPNDEDKRIVLRAVDAASRVVPRRAALKVLRLASARYHAWRHAEVTCDLDDRPNCPRVVPSRLTAHEIRTMKEMATAVE